MMILQIVFGWLVEFVQQHKWALIIGAGLGLALGLAIGWWWWPVEWTNSTPGNLRSDFQRGYLLWVAEQRASSGDLWARETLGMEFWKEDQLGETLEGLAQGCEQGRWQECDGEDTIRLLALAQALDTSIEPTPAEGTPAPTEPATGGGTMIRSVAGFCGGALLLVAFVVGVWFLVSYLRKPRAVPEAGRGVGVAEGLPPAERVSWGVEGPPLAQFVTTYALGDDHYDPSFSIELENAEFMGECGVGVSETIGVGAPNKVTAFEVWLFDKNDIRTVTMVLMSDYAFHDEALRTKLAPKGEPVLAKKGTDLTLETKTLRVRARVVEAEHGVGNLPPNSFFGRMTIDLAAWAKPGQEGAEAMTETDAPVMPPTL